jgi:carbamoyl-phosphate synthase large subunit
MNVLLSCIGKRGYIAEYLRAHLHPGERVIGTSHTPWTPGFHACDLGVLMPPIASDEYVPAVIETCARHDVRGLLSFFDPDVVTLAPHRETLNAVGVLPLIPGEHAASTAYDKWLSFHVLRAAGFRVPDTTIDLDEARAGLHSGRFQFPLIVKPRTGFGSANVFMARNEIQLEAFFSYAPGMLIQQFICGDNYDVEVLADAQQRVLQVVPWRRLLSRAGETEQAMTVEAPALIEMGERLANTVGLIGPMDVDLIRGPDGETWVIELNLRFGGGYPVSHLAGADFPAMIVEMFRGLHPEPRIGRYRRDVCLLKGLHVMGGPVEPFLHSLRCGPTLVENSPV